VFSVVRAGRRLALATGALLAMAMLVPTAAFADAAPAAPTHGLEQRGSNHGRSVATNLVDHGGPVLPTSHLYAIWWGSPSTWAGTDIQAGMASFFSGLNRSSYVNTAAQYMRGASLSVVVSGTVADTSSPPKKIGAITLGNEVQKEVNAQLLPVDPSGIYFLFTSNAQSGGFCAAHTYAPVSGTTVSVAYMPNESGVAGCAVSGAVGGFSAAAQSLANLTAHEFMESVTDPFISAWYDKSGSEIGDKCAWQFGSPVTLKNGSIWQLQEEWSNLAGGCVQIT
jgi:hypothetical protein